MISIPFLICIIGLALWLIFAKTKLADPWVAEVGRICFIKTRYVVAIALIESELKREAKNLIQERREAESKNGEKG